MLKAVSSGERRFKGIAITSDSDELTMPCGACLQVLAEFFDDDAFIIASNNHGKYQVFKFKELSPYPFRLKKTG